MAGRSNIVLFHIPHDALHAQPIRHRNAPEVVGRPAVAWNERKSSLPFRPSLQQPHLRLPQPEHGAIAMEGVLSQVQSFQLQMIKEETFIDGLDAVVREIEMFQSRQVRDLVWQPRQLIAVQEQDLKPRQKERADVEISKFVVAQVEFLQLLQVHKGVPVDLLQLTFGQIQQSQRLQTSQSLRIEFFEEVVAEVKDLERSQVRESVRIQGFQLVSSQVQRFESPETVEGIPGEFLQFAVTDIQVSEGGLVAKEFGADVVERVARERESFEVDEVFQGQREDSLDVILGQCEVSE